jgi:branched-chain amino acid transport system substrate-binding protein
MLARNGWSLLLGLGLALGIAPQAVPAADTVDIPAQLPLTGPAAFIGKAFQQSLKALEDAVNKSGGIRGRQLNFVFTDDESSPQIHLQLTTAALAKHPSVVIDGGPLASCRTTMPLITNGPVVICLSPALKPEAGSWAYTVMPSTDDNEICALNYLRDRGLKRVAVLNGTDATGQDTDAVLQALIGRPEYASRGVQIVAWEHFNLTDLSVAAQMSRIKAARAQALISIVTGTAFATVLRGASDAGLGVPVITGIANMALEQLSAYKTFLPPELLFESGVALAPEALTDRAVRQKVADFRQAITAQGLQPNLLLGVAWDAAGFAVDALRKLGPNATPAQIRDELNNLRGAPGIWGRYDFRAIPQRGIGAQWVIMTRYDEPRGAFPAVSKPGGQPLS